MNVRQALSSEKRFLSPRRGSNPQPSDDGETLTIELPKLRWWAKVQVRHLCDLSGSHYMLIMWHLTIWVLVTQWLGRLTGHQKSGAQKSFSEDRAWRTFIYHSRYLQAPTFPKIYISLNEKTSCYKTLFPSTFRGPSPLSILMEIKFLNKKVFWLSNDKFWWRKIWWSFYI